MLTEELSGFLIAKHLGQEFVSKHTGDQDSSADCLIFHNETETGIVETTTNADPKHEELMQLLLKSDGKERMDLPQGSGAWVGEMKLGVKFKRLTVGRLSELIAMLRESGLTYLHQDHSWPAGPELEALSQLGLRSVRFLDIEGDFFFRFMPIVGGQIDDSPNLLADFAESVINSTEIAGKLDRMSSRANGLHRHFCIVVGTDSGLSVQWRMNDISMVPPLPEREIVLPGVVDSLWVMSREAGKILRFNPANGWSQYQYVSEKGPWWVGLELEKVKQMEALLDQHRTARAQD